jgi:serine/threonine-protein phosphatase PGAM5
LTKLGCEQAALLGKRISSLSNGKIKFDKLVMSTMTRATETANIILENMDQKSLKIKNDSIIEEGAPYPPEPPLGNWREERSVTTTI